VWLHEVAPDLRLWRYSVLGPLVSAKLEHGDVRRLCEKAPTSLPRNLVMDAYRRQAETVLATRLNPILKTRRLIGQIPIE